MTVLLLGILIASAYYATKRVVHVLSTGLAAQRDTAVPPAESVLPPESVPDGAASPMWTARDDRQLTRLLKSKAP